MPIGRWSALGAQPAHRFGGDQIPSGPEQGVMDGDCRNQFAALNRTLLRLLSDVNLDGLRSRALVHYEVQPF